MRGFRGTTGVKGFRGTTGVRGFRGATGVRGFRGATGVRGFRGATGVRGFRGARGRNLLDLLLMSCQARGQWFNSSSLLEFQISVGSVTHHSSSQLILPDVNGTGSY